MNKSQKFKNPINSHSNKHDVLTTSSFPVYKDSDCSCDGHERASGRGRDGSAATRPAVELAGLLAGLLAGQGAFAARLRRQAAALQGRRRPCQQGHVDCVASRHHIGRCGLA